jgi:hypothetical protein
VITAETIAFMRKLDVKEIHGYHASSVWLLRMLLTARDARAATAQAIAGHWPGTPSTRRSSWTAEMWHWLVDTLTDLPGDRDLSHPGLGFWVGKFKFGSFSLGVVTSTLLAGVLIGQLEITISGHVKSTFLPHVPVRRRLRRRSRSSSRGLKGDGIQQAMLFAVIQCVAVLVTAVGRAIMLGYDAGGTPRDCCPAIEHDLRGAGAWRPTASASSDRRCREAGDARCDAGRLRGDVPVRHRGFGLDCWPRLGPKILRST